MGMMNEAGKRFRICLAAGSLLVYVAAAALFPSRATAEVFTVACMPDPQYYTTGDNERLFNLYRKQAAWLVANKDLYKIKHTIWLGDLTNDNTSGQWAIADRAYKILDDAGMSYAVCSGNHDYKTPGKKWAGANFRDLSLYNGTVGPQRFKNKSFYGGNMGETTDHNENNYTFFSAAGMDFMVVSLEFTPRKDALTWASDLITAHPDKRVIILTHAYLTSDGRYAGGGGSQSGTVGANGVDVFEELAKRHSNIFMVVCGHVGDSEKNFRSGIAGNSVTEMLVDYQFETVKGNGTSNLGNGWLRLLTFDTNTNIIQARTITVSPNDPDIFQGGITQFYRSTYEHSVSSPDHQYDISYNMGPLQPYTYMNSSLTFQNRAVGQDLLADQQSPRIAQADNGNWVSAWAEDADKNGIFQIQARGFDIDGNERFSNRLVNTFNVNTLATTQPAISMAPDGRFAVVWRSGLNAIKVRTYQSDGTPVTAMDQVVTLELYPTELSDPDISMDDQGRFVVAWTEVTGGGTNQLVKCQAFNADGSARFPARAVSLTPTGKQHHPKVAVAANGNYVVTWQDDSGTYPDIWMRGFMDNSSEMFSERFGSSTTNGVQGAPAVAMDRSSGRFVIAWEDDGDLNNTYQVRARGYEANGSQRFTERTVNIKASGNQLKPAVSMDTDGKWCIAWEDNGQGGDGYQLMSNIFDDSGTRLVSTDTRDNYNTKVSENFGPAVRMAPSIAGHKSGRYVVAWADDMDGNGAFQGLAHGVAGTAKSLALAGMNGTVTRFPDQPSYRPDDTLTLTPVAKPGFAFSKWLGDVPTGQQTANPLPVTMSANKAIRALFVPSSDVADWELY